MWPFRKQHKPHKHTQSLNAINNMAQTQSELAAELLALNEQQKKIAAEQAARFDAQTAAIAALEAAIANAPVSDAVASALAELKATTDALDATIPDAPTP